MAESPSHKFGQIIGDALEAAITPLLKAFADKHGLYLDGKGPRPARSGTKVTWVDLYGNAHDLDHVLEKGGTPDKTGVPIAFIETAWRRYTKHSRNKAQEIQGAILPLVSTHHHSAPFMGAVLAGEFTEGALNQLRSLRFKILYFPYVDVIQAFRAVRIDASCDEQTADAVFAAKVNAWNRLSQKKRLKVAESLLEICKDDVKSFFEALELTVLRQIKEIVVYPLHGRAIECPTVTDAIARINSYREAGGQLPVMRYEAEVRYNNGDKVAACFKDKDDILAFLNSFLPPPIHPA